MAVADVHQNWYFKTIKRKHINAGKWYFWMKSLISPFVFRQPCRKSLLAAHKTVTHVNNSFKKPPNVRFLFEMPLFNKHCSLTVKNVNKSYKKTNFRMKKIFLSFFLYELNISSFKLSYWKSYFPNINSCLACLVHKTNLVMLRLNYSTF